MFGEAIAVNCNSYNFKIKFNHCNFELNGWNNNLCDEQIQENSEPIIEEPEEENNADEILTKEQACVGREDEKNGTRVQFY